MKQTISGKLVVYKSLYSGAWLVIRLSEPKPIEDSYFPRSSYLRGRTHVFITFKEAQDFVNGR